MYLSPGSPELIQAARNHLKGLRDWNFHYLLVCTFAVGAGLLMELPEIVQDMCEIFGRKSRERKYWLTPSMDRREYPKRDWVKKWSAFGWILIVLGVMGEGWFEAQVSKYDTALSNMTDSIVAEAQRDAADSKREAESERLARVQLQKELEPRRLTGKQKEQLRGLLSDDPQQIMLGWCLTGSDDCQDFVNDIGEAFNKAGWKTVFSPSTQNKRGIYLGFAKGSDQLLVDHWVPKIRNTLSAVGLASEQKWFDPNEKTLSALGFEKNVLYLIVGQKPAIKTPITTIMESSH